METLTPLAVMQQSATVNSMSGICSCTNMRKVLKNKSLEITSEAKKIYVTSAKTRKNNYM